MKTFATLALSFLLASSAAAAIVHDEAVHGDLSTNPAAPTPVAFAPGTNTIRGTVGGDPDHQDYLTFTISAGQILSALRLMAFAPNNATFASFNLGPTSWFPDVTTESFFLSGIHVSAFLLGTDLMPSFVNSAVTTNALPSPQLAEGTYTFLFQQANVTRTSYELEFEIDGGVPTTATTWGALKSLYR